MTPYIRLRLKSLPFYYQSLQKGKAKSTFLAFVDLEQAFDNVDWNTLFQIQKSAGVKYGEQKVIYNFYKSQTAVIRVEGHERDAEVGKGVRQG